MTNHYQVSQDILELIAEELCRNDEVLSALACHINEAIMEVRKACIEIAEGYHSHDQATELLHPEQTAIERATALEIGRKLRAMGQK